MTFRKTVSSLRSIFISRHAVIFLKGVWTGTLNSVTSRLTPPLILASMRRAYLTPPPACSCEGFRCKKRSLIPTIGISTIREADIRCLSPLESRRYFTCSGHRNVDVNGSCGISEAEVKKQIDHITEKFMEAREFLDDAIKSKGTVYFEDDLRDAQETVQETLATYYTFLSSLNPEQKQNVLRTIGLKMEELRAQEQSILEELKRDD